MTRDSLRRVATMQSEELRFRVICELRKAAGRVRYALSTPRWDRRTLADVLSPNVRGSGSWPHALSAVRSGEYAAAHAALADHFARRYTPFPLNARHLDQVATVVIGAFPDAVDDAVERAERVLLGQYTILGHHGVAAGNPPDWHADAVHGRRSPHVFWAAVPYLDPSIGDHKVIWELNRHHQWLALGRAWALTGDRRFYRAFTAQLASWLAANPPHVGTNWASMLELGLRSLTWLWALEFFAAAAGPDDQDPWLVDFLVALDRQLTHIEHNLSYYFSPNTHLTGEALALYVAGLAVPELKASRRRAAAGRDVLIKEATRQVRSDGGHAELSAHYHRYSTDFYLLATAVGKSAGDPAAAVFEEAARRQAHFLRAITDDHGIRPPIGDDDGGQLFPICGRPSADCRDTLASAAVLLGEPSLGIGPAPEETYWLCGVAAGAAPIDGASWTSTALPASGYYISRTPRGDHLVFDAGPHGYLNAGHAHADALSCTLAVGGRPVLIDPGTGTYTMDPEVRDRFRSTKMHNTVVLDGQSQGTPSGPFRWSSAASAHAPIWRSSSDCDYVEGTHDGYAPRRHTRAILAVHGLGWWIVDHVVAAMAAMAATGATGAGGPVVVETYWHVHPSWACTLRDSHSCRLDDGHVSLGLASSAPLTLLRPGDHPEAFWSPAYGVIEPAPVARGVATVSVPATIATFIPAVPEIAAHLDIEETPVDALPGPDWHGCAFRVRWSGGAMVMMAAIERTGVANRDTSAPIERWGTAELQTDARVAVLIDRASGVSEAILVNGACVIAQPAHELVSLSRRVPLLRLSSRSLAPGMHELGTAP